MNDDARWFLAYDGERRGPFTEGQVRSMAEAGAVHAETLAWRKGFEGWKPVRDTELDALLPLAAHVPPVPVRRPSAARSRASVAPAADGRPNGDLSPWGYFVRCLRERFVDFGGRSRRKEYWSFVLFAFLFGIAALIAIGVLLEDEMEGLALLILAAYPIGFVLPGLAVTVRRLHDVGFTGWFLLLYLVPFGQLVLLIFMLLPSQPKENGYGPVPAGVTLTERA